jgi:hypothetical protein
MNKIDKNSSLGKDLHRINPQESQQNYREIRDEYRYDCGNHNGFAELESQGGVIYSFFKK